MRDAVDRTSETRLSSVAETVCRHPAGLVCAALLLALVTLALRIASLW